MTGEVQLTVASPAAGGSLVKAGKVKALAIGGLQRSSLFPDVPTIAESGYPYADAAIWFGLFAPGGTSAQLVDRISRDVIGIAKRPDFINKYITAFALDLVANTPSEFAAVIRAGCQNTAFSNISSILSDPAKLSLYDPAVILNIKNKIQKINNLIKWK